MEKKIVYTTAKAGGVSELSNNNIVHTMSKSQYVALGKTKRKEASVCKKCTYNDKGFCKKYNKWGTSIREQCNKNRSNKKVKKSYSSPTPIKSSSSSYYFHQLIVEWSKRDISSKIVAGKNIYWILLLAEEDIVENHEKYTGLLIFNKYIRQVKIKREVNDYGEYLLFEIKEIMQEIKYDDFYINIIAVNKKGKLVMDDKIKKLEKDIANRKLKCLCYIINKERLDIDDIIKLTGCEYKYV